MIDKTKNTLRKQMRLKRSQLNDREVTASSAIIQAEAIKIIHKLKPNSVHIYQSITKNNEVSTDEIISFLQKKGIEVNHPDPQIFTKNQSFDVAIIPLIAFDLSGNRLGYGGGYYDKFLAFNDVGISIGLAYEFQLTSSVPTQSHDQKINSVITEKNIYNFS